MKGISRLLNKKCKRFKHHIRNILQNDIANKYITPPPSSDMSFFVNTIRQTNSFYIFPILFG